ncbi:MAG: ferrous iron transport protein A [Oligosphaeraceae bacterium]
MKTLKELAVGESAVVVRLNSTGAMRRRLLDMGLTKGVKVTLRKVAPLGDPLEITLRGYELTLRKSEAEWIEVE